MTKLDLTQRLSRWLPLGGAARAAAGAWGAESVLVASVRAGDPAAIDQVYRAHQQVLRAFAQRLTGEPEVAEDLVHDVFVSLPRLVQGFRGHSSLRTFLIGVAAKLAGRHVRTARRRRAALAQFAEVSPSACAPALDQARYEQARHLYHALDALPLPQRTAFVLCEVEERSVSEVASILGIPEATVRTRCFHARKKLCQRLAEVR